MKKFFLILISLFLVFGSIYLFRWEKVSIEVIKFRNFNFVLEEDLDNFAKNYIGKNSFWCVFSGKLRRDIIEAFQQIYSVQFKFVSINHIAVTVKEKLPWVVFISEGKSFVISEDGSLLNPNNSSGEIENLRQLVVIKGVPVHFLEHKTIHPDLMEEVMGYVTKIRTYFDNEVLQIEFSGLIVDDNQFIFNDVALIKDDSLVIRLGTLNFLAERLEAVKIYLSQLTEHEVGKLNYIDLRIKDRLIINEDV